MKKPKKALHSHHQHGFFKILEYLNELPIKIYLRIPTSSMAMYAELLYYTEFLLNLCVLFEWIN